MTTQTATLTPAQQALLKAFDAQYTAAFTALQNAQTDMEALSRTAKLAQITNARNEKLAQFAAQAVSA